jgi:flavin reductase (DIM6/NTAB) family NADH-FMN oxidoreductase RutF
MSTDAGHFRRVMSHFATGVTVVTGRDEGGSPVGLTANAVTSVSLEPALILVCLDRLSESRPVLLRTGRFGVSILRSGQEALARRFSRADPEERFEGLELRTEVTGVPLLASALGWADCRVWKSVEAGDHTVLLGEVLACDAPDDGHPLVFFRGGFGTVAS